jgi:hypothetical protein
VINNLLLDGFGQADHIERSGADEVRRIRRRAKSNVVTRGVLMPNSAGQA